MQNTHAVPVAVAIPTDARAHGFYATPYLADAYAISLPPDVVANPEQLARYVFENQPAWVDTLMGLRDTLVAGFGLKTAKQLSAPSANKTDKRVGIFKIYASSAQEVFLGEDDSHLDFRISVQFRPVAKQTSKPAFKAACIASLARGGTVPSEDNSVPSKSIAIIR